MDGEAAAPRSALIGGPGVVGVVAAAIALTALALYALWVFWPAEAARGGMPPARESISFLGLHATLSRDGLLVVVAACSGALGTLPRIFRSLGIVVGNRELSWPSARRYALTLVFGTALAGLPALLFHVAFPSADGTSPYRLAALATLLGFLADHALRALRRRRALKNRRR